MKIDAGSRLLFIGDSVTDCGRARPVGVGSQGTLGSGYVAEVDAALTRMGLVPSVEVLNTGIGGNTVRDLARRWDADVLAHNPDWLTVMIGINDVWRMFDSRGVGAVIPHEFLRTYDTFLGKAPAALKGLVLMSPFYVQKNRSDPMRTRMDEYGAIVKDIASRRGALFVDVQAALDREMETQAYIGLAADRVHPTELGHWVLARGFLEAVGATPRPRP
ncbi:MAG TPA: SGNH/GDSL hydrolase family protein [Opitutaceae bacterium]|jgi:lysophospholipase L1-like esterase|nr:SGNH/GDSL hydrolase family protein [Opitutaceae bacterium]